MEMKIDVSMLGKYGMEILFFMFKVDLFMSNKNAGVKMHKTWLTLGLRSFKNEFIYK